ncbi:putative protein N(5)-glutamine methyltransferase [Rhodococcus chondri]|uniref:peptide chain release factor N(5)-glutamine methyltransferase n=1 Tax=Rhodococcus chondri TaxID=3065941 RepID=A0ABU7JNV8_9NOCA|nr:putative protein N(5)-glutamine methyltransferase [Rhodococcus sp. CC-R104]MEE2031715.1 putative protein N(5)-glutamine methyltransferase [Rhodococcus sp. CC-R104]
MMVVSSRQLESSIAATLRSAGCVFAEDEARLLLDEASTVADLAALVTRRVSGEPLEHIVGWVAFCGERMAVDPGVFVPRRRTEFLVHCATEVAPARPVVVDMCCGSGAVAAALHTMFDASEVYAADIDPAAVRCARRNLPAERVFQGDLYAPLPGALYGHVDVLVANAPYVPTGALSAMPREARCSEPRVALDGGSDGLDIHRRLASGAAHWLAPNGCLLIETAESQAGTAQQIFARAGLAPRVVSSDDLDATVVVGFSR